MTIPQTRHARMLLPGPLLALLVLTGGCGSSDPGTSSATSAPTTAAASPGPSKAAALVCSHEAAEDIEGALGVRTTQPPKPVWVNHVNSCAYRYPSGAMRLSVTDLPDAGAVAASFEAARTTAGRTVALRGLGEGAFSVADGSVYVRKDLTVLHVDVSGLPARFGVRNRSQVARTVATTVLICWKEQ